MCPPDTYFHICNDVPYLDNYKCLPLSSIFGEDWLLIDVEFTYNGNTYVQHQALVTLEQCTSEYV